MVFSQSKHSILRKLNLVRRTSCDCPTGYAPSGHSVNLCLSPVNTCWNNPCENNGKCVPTETGYYCECKSGSRGKNCEYVKGDHRDVSAELFQNGLCLPSGSSLTESEQGRIIDIILSMINKK